MPIDDSHSSLISCNQSIDMKAGKKYGFRFLSFADIFFIDNTAMISRSADGAQWAGVERFFDLRR